MRPLPLSDSNAKQLHKKATYLSLILLFAFVVTTGCNSGTSTKSRTPDELIELVKTGDLASLRSAVDADKSLANARREDGTPLLYFAATNGHRDILVYLLEMGANADARASYGSALHVAAQSEHEEIVQELLDWGADPNLRDDWGQTPLHLTRQNERADVAKSLMEAGGDLNARDGQGRTPLHRCKSLAVAELLVDRGADVNAVDEEGYTTLHWAGTPREIVDRPTIEFLLAQGADVHRKNKAGLTPRQLAIVNDQTALVAILDTHKNEQPQ